jgi:hypothetical protein
MRSTKGRVEVGLRVDLKLGKLARVNGESAHEFHFVPG